MSATASASASKQADSATARPQLTILAGERIHILENHFDVQRRGILGQTASDLGATIIPTRAEATIIVVNPRHPTYRQELDAAQRSDPNTLATPLISYHWLAACRLAGFRLDPAAVVPSVPYFVHPDRSTEHQPLRAWVSVNIHRGKDPGPHEAKRAVQDLLELGGCVITERRAAADLLVVDKASKFYEGTVLPEVKNNSRTWQRIVERDWVEACVRQGKMQWPARGLSERSEPTDSMEEEDAAVGRGPGRPKGKPRTEYTPEEDNFLCRYLAAWHPDGSWLSRKTFEIMTKRNTEFPIVERHSAQSWHERFKKNSGALSNRVNRYIHAGIREKDLKTAKEVENARQAEASIAASSSASTADRPAPSKTAPAGNTSAAAVHDKLESLKTPPAPSAQAEAQVNAGGVHERTTIAEREGARLTQIAAHVIGTATGPAVAQPRDNKEKRQLVDAEVSGPDDERPSPSRRPRTPLATQPGGSTGQDDRRPTSDTTPPAASLSGEAPVHSSTSAIAPEARAPLDTATSGQDERASGGLERGVLSETKQPATYAAPEAAAPTHGPALGQTLADQVLMHKGVAVDRVAPAAEAKAEALANPPPPEVAVQVVAISADDGAPNAVLDDAVERGPAGHVTQPGSAVPIPASSRLDSRSPKKVRLDIEVSPEQQAPASRPAELAPNDHPPQFLVRDLRDITKPSRPRQSLPAQLAGTPDRSAHPRFSTPILTPRKRSLMQDHMLSSEKKRRRRSLDPAQSVHYHPDVVLASTRFPPARVQDPNAPPPPPIIPRSGPPPPMTQEERNNRILSGQAVALRHRDEYKRHVTQLCEKYGISPRDVSDFVNAMPKRRNATGELYWRDVEAGLHERFGGTR